MCDYQTCNQRNDQTLGPYQILRIIGMDFPFVVILITYAVVLTVKLKRIDSQACVFFNEFLFQALLHKKRVEHWYPTPRPYSWKKPWKYCNFLMPILCRQESWPYGANTCSALTLRGYQYPVPNITKPKIISKQLEN